MTEKRRPGRPRGKKSSRDYVQISAYVTASTYKALKHALIDDEMEQSELIQKLLDDWLISRSQLPPKA